jgi:hypothetical protein
MENLSKYLLHNKKSKVKHDTGCALPSQCQGAFLCLYRAPGAGHYTCAKE